MAKLPQKNFLYLGDCLQVLRENVPRESVDLIYIDPPFNSKRNYNIFFDNQDIQSQRVAFEDTWSMKSIQDSLVELESNPFHRNLYRMLMLFSETAPATFPYLVMMTLRMIELHRVLTPTGSFYLHCDPTASHYLKTLLDVIFGSKGFLSEISWKRSSAHSDTKQGRQVHGHIHDSILYYAKGERWTWNPLFTPYDPEYVKAFYRHVEEGTGRLYRLSDLTAAKGGGDTEYSFKGATPYKGRYWAYSKENLARFEQEGRLHFTKKGMPSYKRYLDEMPGVPLQDIWMDLRPLGAQAAERLGYPTQKPESLLERIILSSSNPGDLVLDAFCGCGTTINVAERLDRRWIGIDVSPTAVALMKSRLQAAYKDLLRKFEIRGIPSDLQSALELCRENKFAFQDWWLTELNVFSTTLGTRGPDGGLDGLGIYAPAINDMGQPADQSVTVGYQVKGGASVQSGDMDRLMGSMVKHKCHMGALLSVAKPTNPILRTVNEAGSVEVAGVRYPKLQTLTLEQHFEHKALRLPRYNVTFKAARFAGAINQLGLGF